MPLFIEFIIAIIFWYVMAVVRVIRGHKAVFITVIIVIWWLICGMGISIGRHKKVSDEYNISYYYHYIVQPGDSIDEICAEYSDADEDLLKLRELILEVNNKTDCNIKAGEVLKIPVDISEIKGGFLK